MLAVSALALASAITGQLIAGQELTDLHQLP